MTKTLGATKFKRFRTMQKVLLLKNPSWNAEGAEVCDSKH
ncbi:hypothetical protein F442_04733 [Phytophthora nicotianae P10297]|uniref:Uncharacterized protein n=4 Tax=Phytophthora nicotianae TaxID=4792 RepID=V9FNY2_PHYNI|nr:hypothetical protein F443_04680 [Phytophthora nicotianae P1569]ETK91981.1 hypothetical protein L915_04567 [Phytophthora nicotianae]ETL45379.1 hypothetical protein L916_04524 [Phytophthora nicotianae]ETO80892.1 hypothetical protein F444_04713 [Phytophthora nicotianae P1976]ETP49830.1 hypothetical protein F442_04733 [Phytophthora nicotianae P10297]